MKTVTRRVMQYPTVVAFKRAVGQRVSNPAYDVFLGVGAFVDELTHRLSIEVICQVGKIK